MSFIDGYFMSPGVANASQKYLDSLLSEREANKQAMQSSGAVASKVSPFDKAKTWRDDAWDYAKIGGYYLVSRSTPFFVSDAEWQMSDKMFKGFKTGRESLNIMDDGTSSVAVGTSSFNIEGGLMLDRITRDLGFGERYFHNITVKYGEKDYSYGGTRVGFDQRAAFEYQVFSPDGVLDGALKPFGVKNADPIFTGEVWKWPVDAARVLAQWPYWLQNVCDSSGNGFVKPLAWPFKLYDNISNCLVGYNYRYVPLDKNERYDATDSTVRFVTPYNPSEVSQVVGVDYFWSGRNLGNLSGKDPDKIGLLRSCYFTTSFDHRWGTQIVAIDRQANGQASNFELEFVRNTGTYRFDAPKLLGEGSGMPWLKGRFFASYTEGTEHYEVSPGMAASFREENLVSGVKGNPVNEFFNPLGMKTYTITSPAGGVNFDFTLGTARIPLLGGPEIDWKIGFGFEGSVENKQGFRKKQTYNPTGRWNRGSMRHIPLPNLSFFDLVELKFQRIDNPIQYFDPEGQNPLRRERQNRWEATIPLNRTEWLWKWIGGGTASAMRFMPNISIGRETTSYIGGGKKEAFSYVRITLPINLFKGPKKASEPEKTYEEMNGIPSNVLLNNSYIYAAYLEGTTEKVLEDAKKAAETEAEGYRRDMKEKTTALRGDLDCAKELGFTVKLTQAGTAGADPIADVTNELEGYLKTYIGLMIDDRKKGKDFESPERTNVKGQINSLLKGIPTAAQVSAQAIAALPTAGLKTAFEKKVDDAVKDIAPKNAAERTAIDDFKTRQKSAFSAFINTIADKYICDVKQWLNNFNIQLPSAVQELKNFLNANQADRYKMEFEKWGKEINSILACANEIGLTGADVKDIGKAVADNKNKLDGLLKKYGDSVLEDAKSGAESANTKSFVKQIEDLIKKLPSSGSLGKKVASKLAEKLKAAYGTEVDKATAGIKADNSETAKTLLAAFIQEQKNQFDAYLQQFITSAEIDICQARDKCNEFVKKLTSAAKVLGDEISMIENSVKKTRKAQKESADKLITCAESLGFADFKAKHSPDLLNLSDTEENSLKGLVNDYVKAVKKDNDPKSSEANAALVAIDGFIKKLPEKRNTSMAAMLKNELNSRFEPALTKVTEGITASDAFRETLLTDFRSHQRDKFDAILALFAQEAEKDICSNKTIAAKKDIDKLFNELDAAARRLKDKLTATNYFQLVNCLIVDYQMEMWSVQVISGGKQLGAFIQKMNNEFSRLTGVAIDANLRIADTALRNAFKTNDQSALRDMVFNKVGSYEVKISSDAKDIEVIQIWRKAEEFIASLREEAKKVK
jgi:hypothetical protein